MSFWSFYISKNEIEIVAHDLIERHGESAREEAIRLAMLGVALALQETSRKFRRAARYIASQQMTTATGLPVSAARSGIVVDPLAEFASPRVAVETEACE